LLNKARRFFVRTAQILYRLLLTMFSDSLDGNKGLDALATSLGVDLSLLRGASQCAQQEEELSEDRSAG